MKPVVLIVDNPDGIRGFQNDIQPFVSERWEVLFATSAKESFGIMVERDVCVLVFNICHQELDPISYSYQINKQFPKVQVVFDGSRNGGKECRLTRQEFLKSSAFDFVGESEVGPEVVERIDIAIKAKQMQDTGFF